MTGEGMDKMDEEQAFKQFGCHICEKVYDKMEDLLDHIQSAHVVEVREK